MAAFPPSGGSLPLMPSPRITRVVQSKPHASRQGRISANAKLRPPTAFASAPAPGAPLGKKFFPPSTGCHPPALAPLALTLTLHLSPQPSAHLSRFQLHRPSTCLQHFLFSRRLQAPCSSAVLVVAYASLRCSLDASCGITGALHLTAAMSNYRFVFKKTKRCFAF